MRSVDYANARDEDAAPRSAAVPPPDIYTLYIIHSAIPGPDLVLDIDGKGNIVVNDYDPAQPTTQQWRLYQLHGQIRNEARAKAEEDSYLSRANPLAGPGSVSLQHVAGRDVQEWNWEPGNFRTNDDQYTVTGRPMDGPQYGKDYMLYVLTVEDGGNGVSLQSKQAPLPASQNWYYVKV